ncbi:hypothetical protein ACV35F_34685, partial [Pseudomonas aeruginosa]
LGELLAQRGSVRNVQLRLQHKDRNGLDCLVSAEAVSLNEQDCVLVALLDISDRRRTLASFSIRVRLNQEASCITVSMACIIAISLRR